jgi:hypothetical protein
VVLPFVARAGSYKSIRGNGYYSIAGVAFIQHRGGGAIFEDGSAEKKAREIEEGVGGTSKMFFFRFMSHFPLPTQQQAGTFASRAFIRKRIARLAPIYLLTNLAGSFVFLPAFVAAVPFGLVVVLVLLTLLFLTSWLSTVPVGNGASWTLSTMGFFYLVVMNPKPSSLHQPFFICIGRRSALCHSINAGDFIGWK